MGQEILYCHQCQSRVLGADFDRGGAFRIDDRPTCAACAREILPSFPLRKQREILNQTPRKTLPPVETPRTPRRPLPSAPARSALPLAAAVGAAALALVFAIVVMSRGGPPPPPPPAAPAVPDRERAAASALDVARAADVGARLPLLEKVAADFGGTAAARDARRDIEELLERKRRDVEAAQAALLERVRGMAAAEDYGKALELLREERKRRGESAWTSVIDGQLKAIGEAAARALAEQSEKAVEARRNGDEAAVAEARKRAERWGGDFATELDRALLGATAPIAPEKDGTLWLRVADATLVASKMKRVGEEKWAIVRSWSQLEDNLFWTARAKPGAYSILINYALASDHGGEAELSVGDVVRVLPMPSTGGWGTFKEFNVGTITLEASGPCRIQVRPLKITNQLGTLRYVRLVPVK